MAAAMKATGDIGFGIGD